MFLFIKLSFIEVCFPYLNAGTESKCIHLLIRFLEDIYSVLFYVPGSRDVTVNRTIMVSAFLELL